MLGALPVVVEVLVLPGFGLSGVLGGGSLLDALVISVTSADFPTGMEAERALPSVAPGTGRLRYRWRAPLLGIGE